MAIWFVLHADFYLGAPLHSFTKIIYFRLRTVFSVVCLPLPVKSVLCIVSVGATAALHITHRFYGVSYKCFVVPLISEMFYIYVWFCLI